jgi:hypothetical protein
MTYFMFSIIEQKFVLRCSFGCDQVNSNHGHEFGHPVVLLKSDLDGRQTNFCYTRVTQGRPMTTFSITTLNVYIECRHANSHGAKIGATTLSITIFSIIAKAI